MARYRVKAGCKHYMRADGSKNKLFREGDIIDMPEMQAAAFLDKLEPLDGVAETISIEDETIETKTSGEDEEPLYEVLHKGGGRYVVVNIDTDEQVNDIYLTKDEANELAKTLNNEESEEGEEE